MTGKKGHGKRAREHHDGFNVEGCIVLKGYDIERIQYSVALA